MEMWRLEWDSPINSARDQIGGPLFAQASEFSTISGLDLWEESPATFLITAAITSSPHHFRIPNAAPPVLTTNPPVNDINVADPHLKLPRTYQWNAALEQSIGSSQSLSLTYVGAIGRKLLRVTNLVVDPTVNPDFPFVSVTDNSATSDYHALQLKFQRRLLRGL